MSCLEVAGNVGKKLDHLHDGGACLPHKLRAIFLSDFPVEGSRANKVLTDDQSCAVYEELLALSVNIKLRHVVGRKGYSLPHMKQQHRRSVGTAIRDIYSDETA